MVTAGVVLALVAGGAVAWASSTNAAQPQSSAQSRLIAASPIDTAVESKFTPIAPCRAANTRVAGGALANTASRDFYVGGTFGFAPEGGLAGGCGVPVSATGVAVTITTVNATHNGYLKVWSTGSAEPATSFMNYGTAFNASVSGTIRISSSGQARIRTFGSSVQVIIDISGYYVAPLAAEVSSSGTLIKGSRVTNAFLLSGTTSSYEVDFDRNVSSCAYAVSSFLAGYSLEVEPRSGVANGVYIYTSLNGTATTDQFYLTVTC